MTHEKKKSVVVKYRSQLAEPIDRYGNRHKKIGGEGEAYQTNQCSVW